MSLQTMVRKGLTPLAIKVMRDQLSDAVKVGAMTAPEAEKKLAGYLQRGK